MKNCFPRTIAGIFLTATILIFVGPLSVRGQMGNDNPTGVAGFYNGNVNTAGSYDPYTGTATRSVTDLSVAGAVGAYPLAFTRTMNSRYTPGAEKPPFGASGSWRHSYEWSIEPVVFQKSDATKSTVMPSVYWVNYPDGRRLSFSAANGDTYFRGGPGISDRFQQLPGPGGGDCFLLLPDGGKVWFQAGVDRDPAAEGLVVTSTFTFQLMGIIDPYGQLTTVRDLGDGCLTIKEPAGRTLKLYYISTPWNGDVVIDRVVASDGRTVKYNYGPYQPDGTRVYTSLANVQYLNNDGSSFVQAIYCYQPNNVVSNGRPLISWAIDPMYAGPMWAISYTFVPYSSGGTYGQLQSENYLDPTTGIPGPAVSSLSANGNSRTETRGDSYSRTFNYVGGQLVSYTDFKGQPSTISYDGNGFVGGFTDARIKTTTTLRDGLLGAVNVLTHPDDEHSTQGFTYYSRDGAPYFIHTRRDELNHTTTFTRDPNTFQVMRIDYPDSPTGPYEAFTYNGFGQVETHTMTTGGVEHFVYDENPPPNVPPRGLLTSYYPPPTESDPNPQDHPTRYSYYTSGPQKDRVQQVIDPRGNTTSFEYNWRGQVTRVTHLASGDNTYVQYGYNVDGTLAWTADENHPEAATDPNKRTRYTYDQYKRLLTVTNPLNETTIASYDLNWANPLLHTPNNPHYVQLPSGKYTIFEYNENFRKIYQATALGTDDAAERRFDYDEVGNLTWVRDPRLKVTTFGYDARNRRIWMDDPIASDRNSSGHTMNWEYDGVGNKLKETRADDAFRSWEYDVPNRITRSIDWRMSTSDPALSTTRTRDLPDPTTHVTTEHLVDAKSAEYTFESDALGRKIKETYPVDAPQVARTKTFKYDAAGNLTLYKNPADEYKHLDYTDSYDSRNRLRHAAWNRSATNNTTVDRSVGQEIRSDYDAASRVTQISTNNGETTVAFGYDEANRQIWEEQTLAGYPTRRVETPRNDDGNRDSLLVPGYYLLYYDYTERNQLFHIKDGNQNPAWTYTYDKAGNVTNRFGQWGLPNGVNYGYDPLNRIELVEQGNATEVFARNHYQYDKVSREVATWRDGPKDEPGSKGEHFWYTTNNQMQEAWYKADNVSTAPSNPATYRQYTYTPDMLNWSSVNDNGYPAPFAANALNQYTSVNGSSPHYDDRFNLDQFGGVAYPHDAANQLTSATGNGHSASFTYDGLGRCVRRIVDTTTRLFTYDGWNPIMEWDEFGNWKAMNLYGFGADEILGRYDSVLAALIYKQDKQGNVTFVLDSNNQTVEKYTYDAYGTPTILSANNTQLSTSAIGNRFMYTGREWIGELGIYDYRHRYYLPSIGRFLQSDPIGFGGGDANLFRYCGNDPMNRSDPMGLWSPPPTRLADGSGGSGTTVTYNGDPAYEGNGTEADPSNYGSTPSGDGDPVNVNAGPTGEPGTTWGPGDFTRNGNAPGEAGGRPGGVLGGKPGGRPGGRGRTLANSPATTFLGKVLQRLNATTDLNQMADVLTVFANVVVIPVGWEAEPAIESGAVLRYAASIRSKALVDPLFHNFPYSFDRVILSSTPTRGTAGSLLYSVAGSIQTGTTEMGPIFTDGVYEMAVNEEGLVVHRVFIPH